MRRLTDYFEHLHKNPPKYFNPFYDPRVSVASDSVREEMEAEGYYDTHTREECATERSKRLKARMNQLRKGI